MEAEAMESSEGGSRSPLPFHPFIKGNFFIVPIYNAEYPRRKISQDSFLNVKFLHD